MLKAGNKIKKPYPMPQIPVQREFRTISGRGSLRIPPVAKSHRKYWLYADLLRQPSPNFITNKPPRQKGYYANILFLAKKYVIREEILEYENQVWTWYADVNGQILYSNQCIAEVEARNLKSIGEALGAFVVLSPSTPTPILENDITEIVVQCRDGAAVSLRLITQAFDLCPDQEENPSPSPDPIPPPPPLPPGQPLNGTNGAATISPPYPGGDDDYVPFPGDADAPPPPPEQGIPGQSYTLTLRAIYNAPLSGSYTFNRTVFAPWLSNPTIQGAQKNEIWMSVKLSSTQARAFQIIGSQSAGASPPPNGLFASVSIVNVQPPL